MPLPVLKHGPITPTTKTGVNARRASDGTPRNKIGLQNPVMVLEVLVLLNWCGRRSKSQVRFVAIAAIALLPCNFLQEL